jgi:RimJ/RimL family protein N-acetyltransferase
MKLGMSRDGVLRQAYRLGDGTRTDLVMMAILKSEWEGRKRVL